MVVVVSIAVVAVDSCQVVAIEGGVVVVVVVGFDGSGAVAVVASLVVNIS